MPEPTAYLRALRASSADLVQSLLELDWSDADVAEPSLCAGWTRGHVLTHLARNADGIADTLAGALRGEIVARYPDGWDARNAAIDDGAARPMAALVADVRRSAERLDLMFGATGEADGWELPSEHGDPAGEWVFRRWREVEVHRVDLAAGYTPDRWPALLVTELLPKEMASLDERVEGAVHVVVTAVGSLAPEHVGAEWTAGTGAERTAGTGEAVEVRGPDWAVLAWLAGRPSAATVALSATPPLREWR